MNDDDDFLPEADGTALPIDPIVPIDEIANKENYDELKKNGSDDSELNDGDDDESLPEGIDTTDEGLYDDE